MAFVDALTTAVLPVMSIAVVGFAIGKYIKIDVRPLSVVTIWVLAPALIFYSMATSDLAGAEMLKLAAGVAIVTGAMAVIGEGSARLSGTEGPARDGLVLSSTFSNCGNFGIPLSTFAFGAVGRNTAVLYLVAQNFLMYTLGVYLAARGGTTSKFDGLREIFRLPMVYALFAAIIARQLGVVPPVDSTVMQTIELTGNSAIPLMLLLVGIQLAQTERSSTLRKMALPNVLRLGVSPAVAVGVVFLFGFNDVTVARVFVLESATPVAITPLILAIEYRKSGTGDISGPEYISTAIFTSTLLAIPLSALLIAILQSGLVI